jgi:hypothetical protein
LCLANFLEENLQLVRNFLGEEFAAGRKMQLVPAFLAGSCSLFRKLLRRRVVLYRRGLEKGLSSVEKMVLL